MHWEDTAPRPGINLGAALGAPDSPTLFRVCLLRVPEGDPLPAALVEFWRRALADGPPACSSGWEVLAVESWPDSGGFTAAFTRADLCDDEPPVFKFRSTVWERLWYDLPDTDDSQFGERADRLENGHISLLMRALTVPPASDLLRSLRQKRPVPLWLTNQTRSKHRVLDV